MLQSRWLESGAAGEAEPQAVSRGPGPVVVGLDGADRQHGVCVLDGGRAAVSTLEQDPDALAEWLDGLRRRFPDRPILIAIEQSRGALVPALRECAGVPLDPINPQQLARYREAVPPSGGKDDPRDAELRTRFLLPHREQLRPWPPDTPETRRLAPSCVASSWKNANAWRCG